MISDNGSRWLSFIPSVSGSTGIETPVKGLGPDPQRSVRLKTILCPWDMHERKSVPESKRSGSRFPRTALERSHRTNERMSIGATARDADGGPVCSPTPDAAQGEAFRSPPCGGRRFVGRLTALLAAADSEGC